MPEEGGGDGIVRYVEHYCAVGGGGVGAHCEVLGLVWFGKEIFRLFESCDALLNDSEFLGDFKGGLKFATVRTIKSRARRICVLKSQVPLNARVVLPEG